MINNVVLGCKEYLESGMTVETRRGNLYLVMLDYNTTHYGIGAIFNFAGGFLTLRDYDDDLTMLKREYSKYDIIKVYKSPDPCVLDKDLCDKKLIWERKEVWI